MPKSPGHGRRWWPHETLTQRGIQCLLAEPSERGILACFEKIAAAEALYIVNPGGYVGKSVAADLGFAYGRGKRIFALQPIHDPPLGDMAVVVTSPAQLSLDAGS